MTNAGMVGGLTIAIINEYEPLDNHHTAALDGGEPYGWLSCLTESPASGQASRCPPAWLILMVTSAPVKDHSIIMGQCWEVAAPNEQNRDGWVAGGIDTLKTVRPPFMVS